ncbi:MAG: hypothetical protein ACXVRS_01370 [Gaiellaceae bacterium]
MRYGLMVTIAVASIGAAGLGFAANASAFTFPVYPTTGARISLFAPPATFPANTPFFVRQGFVCDTVPAWECLVPSTHFVRQVDGHLLFGLRELQWDPTSQILSEFELTDFPSGLPPGTHTLTGSFFVLGQDTLDQTVSITFTSP